MAFLFLLLHSFTFQGGHQALKNKLVKKQTIFIQHSSKSRTANATAFVKAARTANATAFVKAEQFSRGKEITKQWNYYETIAPFTIFDKRLGKARHVNPDVYTKRKILLILEYFKICFYFHGNQKGAHLWQMVAIQGGSATGTAVVITVYLIFSKCKVRFHLSLVSTGN